MPSLDLYYVDELISVRQDQHGGGRGAPPIVDGHRVGTSVNRSCVVMLSALLQGFVEDVFIAISQEKFSKMKSDQDIQRYRTTLRNWGNPNPDNINSLFLRLFIDDVLSGLSWQKCDNDSLKSRLREINQIRNDIAHGKEDLKFNGKTISLSLSKVRTYRNFVEAFGERFEEHVRSKAA